MRFSNSSAKTTSTHAAIETYSPKRNIKIAMADSSRPTDNSDQPTAVHADSTRDLLDACSEKALACLRHNLTPHGLMAARHTPEAQARRYTRIFARDFGICAPAMALSGDPLLTQGAWDSLRTLAGRQAGNGQIPKYVAPDKTDSDFWYVGCIDATL